MQDAMRSRLQSVLIRAFAGGPLPTTAVDISKQRLQHFQKIYRAYEGLPKDSAEHKRLADSAECFLEYFKPFEVKESVLQFQVNAVPLLEKLDRCRKKLPLLAENVRDSFRFLTAYQSVVLEGNELNRVDSRSVYDKVKRHSSVDQPETIVLPSAAELLPGKPDLAKSVIELRNQVLAQEYFFHNVHRRGFATLSAQDMKTGHRLLMKDTDADGFQGGGPVQRCGEFRTVGMAASGFPVIYAYHHEIPALMQQFIGWKNKEIQTAQLHPVLLACRALVHYLHIHPFFDGNGRTARLVFGTALADAGILPVIFRRVDRQQYATAVYTAQMHSDFAPICHLMLSTLLETYDAVLDTPSF